MKCDNMSGTGRHHAKVVPRLLGLLLALIFIVGTAIVTNATVTQIYPSDDATIEDSLPNSNFGSVGSLYVGDAQPSAPNSIARSYLKFDLEELPAGAVIDIAELYMFNTVMWYPAINVGAHFLGNDGWSEGSITWNNAPTGFNASPTDIKTINMAVWTSWDVTTDVQAEWAGDAVYSVVMKEPNAEEGADGNYVLFNSKEDPQPGDRPYLEITYTTGSAVLHPTDVSWTAIKGLFR